MLFNTQLPSMVEVSPRATSALEAAKDFPTFQSRLKLRPPLAIYNLSISQVVDRFLNTLEIFRQLSPHSNDKEQNAKNSKFLDSLDALLDSLIEHIDDCNHVIRCFFELDNDPKYKKIHSQFKSSIRPYRDHIGKVVNKIKHEQGRLRPISFVGVRDTSYGYFVEGTSQDGLIGPDEKIHAGGNTAFSVARDFRFHICGIYFVGTHLAQAIYEASGIGTKHRHIMFPSSERLAEAIRLVAAIPPIFFPDELTKPIPSIKIIKGSGVLIACGQLHHERVSQLSEANLQVRFYGDGMSTKFRVPYFEGITAPPLITR